MKTYVSIAGIFDKQNVLLSALKSIDQQSVRPDKCFINLSEDPNLLDRGFKDKKINLELENYISSNNLFEIKWVKNTGPFVKLLPLLKEKWQEDCVIITVDDDSVYHKDLIKNYQRHYNEHRCVICHRSFNMIYDSIEDMKYRNRGSVQTVPVINNFHTGKGGVLFHPSFFKESVSHLFDESIYKQCCPTNDDIWFNLHRMANGIKCFASPENTMIKDQSVGKFALWNNFNSKQDVNDVQIQKTIQTLRKLGYHL